MIKDINRTLNPNLMMSQVSTLSMSDENVLIDKACVCCVGNLRRFLSQVMTFGCYFKPDDDTIGQSVNSILSNRVYNFT